MSESQDAQFTESKENSDSESSRPRSIACDEKESPLDGYETPKSECTPTPKSDEPEKNVGNVDTNFAKPPTNSTPGMTDQQHQQNRTNECNLLPVLVERLRSALEHSCSSRSSEDQLPLEDSGVDSEEDLRNWASGLNTIIDQNEAPNKPKLDLKFLEDLLLSDIQTALARLQDTLQRVDIGALTKYNSTLDPTNKLHLLRLISNLLAKLKIPEDAIKSQNPQEKPPAPRRNRSERHTIDVSSEELARARKWLEERNLSPQAEFDLKHPKEAHLKRNSPEDEKSEKQVPENSKLEPNCNVTDEDSNLEKQFNRVHDKYMKDAINQQQSLQNRSREPKDDFLLEHEDSYSDQVTQFYQSAPSAPKYNKFLAKKSRLKRANTIDIPNYLKIKSDPNGCISLRRPIDIGDKVLSNGTSVIPSFQPKTENDRKFLALITKNNDPAPTVTSVPFKNFSHRQNSTVDKNWNNRFSNIKTAFDKPHENNQDSEEKDNRRKSIENEIVGSLKLSYGPTKKPNGFTHAPTSPFQKIEKNTKIDPPAFLKPGYISKSGSNLQAKVKMFDQEKTKTPPPLRTKGKPKTAIFEDDKISENGHINYQTFCKQFAPKGSNVDHARSKFTGESVKNMAKDSIKKMPFVSHENGPFQKSKQKLLKMQQEESYENYPKQYEIYPVNIGYLSEKPRNPRHFDKADDNRRRAFNKFCNEADRSSVGVQTGVESYQDRNRFVNPENRRRSNNASVQTSELDHYKRNFHYPEAQIYQNCFADRRKSSENPRSPPEARESKKFDFRVPRQTESKFSPEALKLLSDFPEMDSVKIVDGPRISNPRAVDSARVANFSRAADPPGIATNLKTDPRLAEQPPPVPERSNYNNVLLRNYKSDQARSKSSYYDYEENPVYVPPIPVRRNSLDKIRYHYEQENKPPEDDYLPNSEHIQNQDISPEGVVTRYASAIATVASMPESPEPIPKIPPYPEKFDEIQRHNQLQQNLSRRMQEQAKSPIVPEFQAEISSPKTVHPEIGYPSSKVFYEQSPKVSFEQNPKVPYEQVSKVPYEQITKMPYEQIAKVPFEQIARVPYEQMPKVPFEQSSRFESKSPTSPCFHFGNKATLRHGSDTESRRTQEKISMFEEINHPPVKRQFRPLNVPRAELHPPRINVVNPSKVIQPKFKNSPIVSVLSPVDSSDEYLMSCANKPSRNIVLTKSESWHQLAMAKNTLQVPPANSQLLKPPKPKSPSSLRLSKQFEASSSSDNIKKMEEKVQRYFQGNSAPESKKESRSKRTVRKNSNSLMRSHTMPHLYDEKIFDESTDVEKAFDSLFKETTRDNRY